MSFLEFPILSKPPERIISLVPSQTELLAHLGLAGEVAGITKFCVHPQSWFRSKVRVGGTKTLHLEKIHSLHPDLIIANKEENVQQQVEALANEFPVWVTDVNNLMDAQNMIRDIGQLVHSANAAAELNDHLTKLFSPGIPRDRLIKVAYLIWQEPFMAAGGGTFIHDMLSHGGFENVFGHLSRYPEISADDLLSSGCDAVLLSSEPFPFREKHQRLLEKIYPGIPTFLVDGELFSWYGSRLLKTAPYLHALYDEINSAIA